MEQSSETQRAFWRNLEVEKTFLETCIQEVSSNGRLGSSLKPMSWIKVKEALESNHNFIASQKQMKNHYDYLREKYQAWLPITKKPGNIYDPTTNTILMSNAEWDKYIKAHPKAKSLKSSPLPYPDLCTTLFDGTTTNGVHSSSPSCETPRPRMAIPSPIIELDASVEGNDKNNDVPSQCPSPLEERKRECPTHAEGPKRKKVKLQDTVEKIFYLLESLVQNQLKIGPTMEACMAKLDEFGWEEPLHSTAVAVFCEKEIYRKAWMNMKDMKVMENWVKIVGKKFGNF